MAGQLKDPLDGCGMVSAEGGAVMDPIDRWLHAAYRIVLVVSVVVIVLGLLAIALGWTPDG